MPQKNKDSIIIMFILITAGILGCIYWWFIQRADETRQITFSRMTKSSNNQVITSGSPLPPPPPPTDSGTFFFPTKVTPGTLIRISSLTTMVLLNQALKKDFEQQFPETQVIVNTQRADQSIQLLLRGSIDIAVMSRLLTDDEKSRGLTAIPIAKDTMTIVVGVQNPFRHGLTQAQVVDIFQGKINNWSALGRSNDPIRVINYPSVSSTRRTFEQLILKSRNFSNNTLDISTTTQDVTTSVLQNLGTDGISYATYSQVVNQPTVRTVPINGYIPEVPEYPYKRSLYYIYQRPPSEAVKMFLGYAVSPRGQKIINDSQ